NTQELQLKTYENLVSNCWSESVSSFIISYNTSNLVGNYDNREDHEGWDAAYRWSPLSPVQKAEVAVVFLVIGAQGLNDIGGDWSKAKDVQTADLDELKVVLRSLLQKKTGV